MNSAGRKFAHEAPWLGETPAGGIWCGPQSPFALAGSRAFSAASGLLFCAGRGWRQHDFGKNCTGLASGTGGIRPLRAS